MSKWKCNSCGEVYSDTAFDGSPAYHVCSPETIEHAKCDAEGKILTPEKRTPRENVRNENMKPGLIFVDGEYILQTPDPTGNVPMLTTKPGSIIISEGAGRTLVE